MPRPGGGGGAPPTRYSVRSPSWYATGSGSDGSESLVAQLDSTTTQPTPAAASLSRPAGASSSCCTSRARLPSPGTVRPAIVRSPVVSTSARTQRGSGSSTGASPAQANRRMLSTGSTATGRGSALISAATAVHAGG